MQIDGALVFAGPLPRSYFRAKTVRDRQLYQRYIGVALLQ